MNYKVNFIVEDDFNGFKGFAIEQGRGYFEPGWSTELIFHDVFEHFFEYSKFFSTKELSQAGECVALGIRSYLDDHSGLVSSFAGYNKFQGCEWNTWNTIIGQVGETLEVESYPYYPNDFNYTTLPNYVAENLFEGYVDNYNKYDMKLPKKLKKQIEMAVSYGYWLGEQIHGNRLNEICKFMDNTKQIWGALELTGLDLYNTSDIVPIGSTLSVNVGSGTITAVLDILNGPTIKWSNNTDIKRLLDIVYNKLEQVNVYY